MNIETTNIDRISSQAREAISANAEKLRAKQLDAFSNKPLDSGNTNLSANLEKMQDNNADAYLREMQSLSQMMNRKIQFDVDYQNREVVVKIVDTETQKTIKQLPAEEIRDLHHKMRETAEMLGFVIDEKA